MKLARRLLRLNLEPIVTLGRNDKKHLVGLGFIFATFIRHTPGLRTPVYVNEILQITNIQQLILPQGKESGCRTKLLRPCGGILLIHLCSVFLFQMSWIYPTNLKQEPAQRSPTLND